MMIKTLSKQKDVKQLYIDINSPSAFIKFTDTLHTMLVRAIWNGFRSVVFVCIGTDRSTGDSLGPLVGHKIRNIRHKSAFVYGTLESPVHAKNLDEVMLKVTDQHEKPYIVAIDACLGRMEHVGHISIGEGSIKPGSAVNKNLTAVGHMYVTGIVNFGGFMDFLILQNTRLCIVMRMADLVSTGIRYVLWKLDRDPDISLLLHGVKE